MVVKRIKDDELYHHGVKGQRWGVRHYQNPDGSLTSAGRQRYSSGREKFTTGKSKGVHRRGEGLGTGPVGRLDTYFGKEAAGRFTDEYKKQMRKNGINQVDMGYDHNLKENLISYSKVDGKDGGNYTLKFKDKASQDRWLKMMELDDDSLINIYENDIKGGASEAEALENLTLHMNDRITTNIRLLEQKGYMDYDPNNSNYNPYLPYTAYTNFDSTTGQVMPLTELHPEIYEENGVDLGINSRRQQYLKDAKETMKNVNKMIKHNKKLTTKVKRFIQAAKEVDHERVEKGKNFLKKLFKK